MSFQKTYQVTVTFSKEGTDAIADTDIQSVELREEIQKGIEKVCLKSKGIYNSYPGTVTES